MLKRVPSSDRFCTPKTTQPHEKRHTFGQVRARGFSPRAEKRTNKSHRTASSSATTTMSPAIDQEEVGPFLFLRPAAMLVLKQRQSAEDPHTKGKKYVTRPRTGFVFLVVGVVFRLFSHPLSTRKTRQATDRESWRVSPLLLLDVPAVHHNTDCRRRRSFGRQVCAVPGVRIGGGGGDLQEIPTANRHRTCCGCWI